MMKTSTAVVAALAGLVLACGSLSPAFAADKFTSDQCLMCHGGNFDALREKTKNHADEFGDVIQPHQYLDPQSAKPHEGAKVVPECTGCHEQHAIPPKGKPAQASLSTCYGCHHMENFQKCDSAGCHDEKK